MLGVGKIVTSTCGKYVLGLVTVVSVTHTKTFLRQAFLFVVFNLCGRRFKSKSVNGSIIWQVNKALNIWF